MAKRMKEIYKRQRKPSIFLICEGKNKTERTFFNHFNLRTAPYNLHIFDSENTDIISMAKKAALLAKEYDLDEKLGDKVYCLVDLDLEQSKFEKYQKAKEKYKKIHIILSNPCFETWLQYYFTQHPKVVNSSQKAKEEMVKFVKGYTETLDIISQCNLGMSEHVQAIDRAEKKNMSHGDTTIISKNPYTEIPEVMVNLISWIKE